MTAPQRPRPLVTAATRQAPTATAGVLAAGGLPGLYLALAPQPFGRLDALIVVALAALPTAAALLRVLSRMVRLAEPDVTPRGDERNDAGDRLLPPDVDLKRLLRANLARQDATERPRRQGPQGTRVSASVADARSATVEDAAAYRAAAGPPSKQPHDDWPVTDFYGDRVRSHDEQRAAERGRDPQVRRGRAVADRADRHRLREPG